MVKNWEDINWKNSSLVIHDLQRKIFDASAKEKGLSIKPKTREFQRKLINCDEAKRIAVRKISQDNRGKRTPWSRRNKQDRTQETIRVDQTTQA